MNLSPVAASLLALPERAAAAAGSGHRAPQTTPPPSSRATQAFTGSNAAAGEANGPTAIAAERAERESSPDRLTARERQIVAELQRIDRQVRAHEQAHLAAAGGLARGVSFRFTTGPDGRRYAVGGEVRIDTAPVEGDPQATIRKARQVRAAANAPANPSPQDRAVAAQASAIEASARQELLAERRDALAQQIRSSQADSFAGHGVDLGSIFNAIG